jgi:ATP-dependent helicase/nuclease subunit A
LKSRAEYFRHILAVTFTNKATQEMKDRILEYLNAFAHGTSNELSEELRESLKLDHATFQQYAQEAQAAILHKYDQFSISTIDAFFQKVIRSFTREAGLVGDYRLEVEQDAVLEEVIDNLMDELGTNKELTDWVVEFAKENLENERAWDVRSSLIEFASEIFREEFKDIEEDVLRATSDRIYFHDLRKSLLKERDFFINTGERLAKRALAIMAEEGWKDVDVKFGKTSGLWGFLERYAYGKTIKTDLEPSQRIRTEFTVATNWPNSKLANAKRMIEVAEQKLVPIIRDLIQLYDDHFKQSLSADVVLQNFYVFGLVADISRKLKEYKDENNLMLLADAPKFLNGVIQDSDTPFIYEKVGSFYKNFLIDEFQDTSSMQWKNFLPLLTNSLDQGYTSLVVGDVKQAIYRWRGGDLNLLQQEIENNIGAERISVNELNSNFRSSSSVVDFNNTVFQKASTIISIETGHPISVQAYRDVRQTASREEAGFVNIKFLKDEEELKWKEQALHSIPGYLEELQELGASLKDIAILVRRNEEGQQIVAELLQYKNSGHARAGFQYEVVSNESLRLDGASSVNLLLAAMRYLLNADDAVARAQLAYEFAKLHEPERSLIDVFAVTNQTIFENNLPTSFTKEKTFLKKLPLYELTETLVSIFKLGEIRGELAYLITFQNLVLEFYSREKNDLGAFLEWWEDNKTKKSIQVSGEVDAVQILTIHKAKGLQFKYVIVPFCAWGLDHDTWQAPNLWVTSQTEPFNQAGYLPVKYSGTLKETLFADFYNEERTRSHLDNLNLLYVALTRAEHGLIVTAPHPEVRNIRKGVAQLLYQSIQAGYPSNESWDLTKGEFKSNEWTLHPSQEKAKSSDTIGLSSYSSFLWRNKIVIKQQSVNFFESQEADKLEKISYGIHIHTVLSRIAYADQIPETLDRMIREGLITSDQKKIVSDQLHELLTNSQVASWFDPSWEVRTEIPILLPSGLENRIDRLMLKGRKAVVVDFKTGIPSKADQTQVRDYVDILRKMNFADVEGYVLYIRTKEVVSVMQGKVKSIKVKDENQLRLGF